MNQPIGDMYHQMYLDGDALDLLMAHTPKLLGLATSLQSWRASTYGKLLRFCDEDTFRLFKTVWTFFLAGGRDSEGNCDFDKNLRDHIEKALDGKKVYLGAGGVVTCLRLALPVASHGIKDLPTLHNEYWTKSTIGKTTAAKNANPTFVSAMPDPLLGLHVAPAYVPIASDWPSPRVFSALTSKQRVVQMAQSHFKVWSAAFRKFATSDKLIMRFFVGDALAFCHALEGLTPVEDGRGGSKSGT